jgi:signal transduction histidine kinase
VTLALEKDGARARISVTDEGAGISPLMAARASEPFFTTKPPGEGTGLGLAIVSEIVRHHRGEFTIVALSRQGTRATIVLPIEGAVS